MFEPLSRAFRSLKMKPKSMSKDDIAEFLRVTPQALAAFEQAYTKAALSMEDDNFFSVNSRDASAQNHLLDSTTLQENNTFDAHELEALVSKIVKELLCETQLYVFDGTDVKTFTPAPNIPSASVSNEDLHSIPLSIRPQLTGRLMKVDMQGPNYQHLLWLYRESLNAKSEGRRKQAYHMFRQGLDILDLDEVMYRIIETNPNSMGHWFPQLVEACKSQSFFKLPATTIARVPLSLLQLTRVDYELLTPSTLRIVDEWAYRAFGLNEEKEYFIKTGTYSSKFDYRNAYVHGAKEVHELGEYLLFIHYQALRMAGPLSSPCIYGVSTTNEWVVREYIPDKEGNPCIYKGLPLHTEYRVFVDCDSDTVIGISPYWEPETMKKRFAHEADANSPHQIHDYIIFSSHEEVLMQRYMKNKDAVADGIRAILPTLNLCGQWSVDVMQNGEDFYIIDMAVAENSEFYECVPKELRHPRAENWLPDISS